MFNNLKAMRTQRGGMMFINFTKLSMVLNKHLEHGILSLIKA